MSYVFCVIVSCRFVAKATRVVLKAVTGHKQDVSARVEEERYAVVAKSGKSDPPTISSWNPQPFPHWLPILGFLYILFFGVYLGACVPEIESIAAQTEEPPLRC